MHVAQNLCIKALGSIGGLDVVNAIKNKYYSFDADHSSGLISILRCIPYSYCEDLVIDLLKNETDKQNKTFLSGALCDIFSLKGMEYVVKLIENKEYDPMIMQLFDHTLPVYFYHNATSTNLQAIESEDKYFIENELNNDPLHQAIEPLRKILNSNSEKKLQDYKKPSLVTKNNVISFTKEAAKRKSSRRKNKKK